MVTEDGELFELDDRGFTVSAPVTLAGASRRVRLVVRDQRPHFWQANEAHGRSGAADDPPQVDSLYEYLARGLEQIALGKPWSLTSAFPGRSVTDSRATGR